MGANSIPEEDVKVIGDSRYWGYGDDEGGGHTIVNSSGAEMPQRSNLKFNNATVTDDAQGDATIVTPAGTDLSKVYQTTDSASSTINDSDYVPMSESGGTKKKTLWSTIITKIKNALGITSSGSTFLRKDGTWATPTDTTYPINYKAVDANIASKFRTETKGDTANGDYISTIRTDDASVTGFPQYGAGLAFGRSDTHGYILPAYNSPGAFWVGGGNADKLNWQANLMTGVKSISRSGTTFTATRFDGTTFEFTQQDNDTKTGDKLTLGASKYGQNLGSMITEIERGVNLDTCIKDLLDNSVFINGKLSNFESFSGDYNTQTLAANTVRAINASTSYKSINISDAGLYVLIAETTATSHVGQRTTSYFTGNDVSSVEMFPQTVPTGQNYFREQLIQFVAVTSSKTVTLMYWDSKSTGARHIWRIIRLLKY